MYDSIGGACCCARDSRHGTSCRRILKSRGFQKVVNWVPSKVDTRTMDDLEVVKPNGSSKSVRCYVRFAICRGVYLQIRTITSSRSDITITQVPQTINSRLVAIPFTPVSICPHNGLPQRSNRSALPLPQPASFLHSRIRNLPHLMYRSLPLDHSLTEPVAVQAIRHPLW